MQLIQSTSATMRAKADSGGVVSVNVAQGEDGTAVLCFEHLSKKGKRVGYFQKWGSQQALKERLAKWPALQGVSLFVDMARAGTLPEAAEKVGEPIATA